MNYQSILDQEERFFTPDGFVDEDYKDIYIDGDVRVGSPAVWDDIHRLVRPNSAVIIGAQFGDEGKGANVDRKIEELLAIRGVKIVYVVRFQGGANAGHTVKTEDGREAKLHHLPSSIMYVEAVGIMDSGMIINIEDLRTEVTDAENVVGDLRGRLILSQDATLATDLHRAQELLNRWLSSGNADGGTGRGISPAVASRIDRTGNQICELLDENWREIFARKYDLLAETIAAHKDFPFELSQMEVPNLRAIRSGLNPMVKIGSKEEFLDRLEDSRSWLISRDMVQNTYRLQYESYKNLSKGILFEGSQAVGLHPYLGRYPDVTSTDTTAYGVSTTGIYRAEDIEESIGVFKIYQSSVGSARMITDLDMERREYSPDEILGLNEDQQYGNWVRKEANERGTTTKRFRDIGWLDLELMRYNCRMGGIHTLAATHLDIAQEDTEIKVCTHYVDVTGKRIAYQPGMKYQKEFTPVYTTLPGWSGEAVRNAKSFDELPPNAQKYLAFIQRSVGVPITIATTGPERQHLIEFEES